MKQELHVYTDGSVTKNGSKNAQGGIGVFFAQGDPRNVSRRFVLRPITTPRTELFAVIRAIDICLKDTTIHHANTLLIIHTDSMYVSKSANSWLKQWKERGWKTKKGTDVKNIDLFRVLDEQLQNGELEISIRHVYGHRGVYGNECADKLAVNGRKSNYTTDVRAVSAGEGGGVTVRAVSAGDGGGVVVRAGDGGGAVGGGICDGKKRKLVGER